MNWSWKIGRIAGIDVFMHWTFLLLLAWIGFVYYAEGQSIGAVVFGILLIFAIFFCIVLHELGHALTARRYGIQTRDITLLPIGGVARLERMPEDPIQELWVALAGPIVSIAIAVVLFFVLLLLGGLAQIQSVLTISSTFLAFVANLFLVNVIIVAFNALPAFPMDGGRVLRALLARKMPYVRATEIAARIGQAMAILFGIAGLFLFFNPFLLLIALFVYLGAEAEARMAQTKALLQGVPVRDAMITRFRMLSPDDTLQTAADYLLAGSQQDFPVVGERGFVGMLRRKDLVHALGENGAQRQVREVVKPDGETVDERQMLDRALEQMRERSASSMPVVRNGEIVGLVTLENVGELMMIRAALEGATKNMPDDVPTGTAEYLPN